MDDGAAGAAGVGDIRGVQLAGCFQHAVGIWDDGDKAGRADDEAAGAAGAEAIAGEFNSQDVANTLWSIIPKCNETLCCKIQS